MMRFLKVIFIMTLLCATAEPGHAWLVQGGSAPPPPSCSNPGPLDAVSETGIFAGGVRAERMAYSGPLFRMSTAGTTGTYADVGLNGCDLNLAATPGGGPAISTACTSTAVPTTTTGCPISIIYNQVSGSSCNPTELTGANQAYIVTNVQFGHPLIYVNSVPADYECDGIPSVTDVTYAISTLMENRSGGPSAAFVHMMITPASEVGLNTIYWWSGSGVDPDQAVGSDGTNYSGSYDASAADNFEYLVADYNGALGTIASQDNSVISTTRGGAPFTYQTGTHLTLFNFQGGSTMYSSPSYYGDLVITSNVGSTCVNSMTISLGGDCLNLYNNMHGYFH